MPENTWNITETTPEPVALPEPVEETAVVSLEVVLARLEQFETEVIELRAENAALKQERAEVLSVMAEGSKSLEIAAQKITELTAQIQDQQTLETHLATAQNALVDARSEARLEVGDLKTQIANLSEMLSASEHQNSNHANETAALQTRILELEQWLAEGQTALFVERSEITRLNGMLNTPEQEAAND